jgi:hypothetical protein
MLKSIYLLIILFAGVLTACGGGSSGSNSLTNVPQLISSSSVSNSIESSAASSSSVTSSSSSSSSASSKSTRSLAAIATLFPVGDSSLSEPVIQITPPPALVQSNESFSLQWVAFSTEGEIKTVSWVQVSGPSVTFKSTANKLDVTAGDVGDVVLEANLTDSNEKTASKKITFRVAQPFSPKTKLLQGSSNGQGLDLVIVGDAFLAEDQAKLESAAQDVLRYIFEYDGDALMHYKPLINVWLVESVSQSRNVPQNSIGVSPGKTLFGAFFGCAGIARLLCVDDQKVIDLVAQYVPQYDQILVLVNSEVYGGAGGQVATASLNGESKNVVLHELSHSIVRLADEYIDSAVTSGFTGEPVEANATINQNALEVKWNYWFDDKNAVAGFNKYNYSNTEVGYFLGGRYKATGTWRPTYTSIMRELNMPYGSVNREAWALAIWSYYSSVGKFLPASNEFSLSEKPLVFSVPMTIDPSYTRISWSINDIPVNVPGSTPFLILSSVDESIQNVKVIVEDDTQFIRRDLTGVSKFQHTWSIQK